MSNLNNKNSKQDIDIARLSERFRALKEQLNGFITNEFKHFKERTEKRIDYLIYLIIASILIPILLKLF